MADYVRDNRKTVIAVAVLAGLFVIALVVFMTRSGGDPNAEGTLVEHAPSASPSPDDTLPEAPTTTTTSRSVTRGAGANPFVPLNEPSEKPTDNSSSGTTDQPSSNKPAQSRDSQPAGPDSSSASDSDTSGSQSNDATKEKPPKNVVPQPIDNGKDSGDAIPVTLLEVQADYVIARVDGDRSKLYSSIPGLEGVTYVAPLGGGCAWLGRTDSEVRVSVCKGQTERL